MQLGGTPKIAEAGAIQASKLIPLRSVDFTDRNYTHFNRWLGTASPERLPAAQCLRHKRPEPTWRAITLTTETAFSHQRVARVGRCARGTLAMCCLVSSREQPHTHDTDLRLETDVGPADGP